MLACFAIIQVSNIARLGRQCKKKTVLIQTMLKRRKKNEWQQMYISTDTWEEHWRCSYCGKKTEVPKTTALDSSDLHRELLCQLCSTFSPSLLMCAYIFLF